MSASVSRPHLLPLLLSLTLAACQGASASPPPSATGTSPSPTTGQASIEPASSASPSPLAGFACGYPLTVGSTHTGPALVTDVTVSIGPDFDTVTVAFEGTGTPELTLANVTPPFVKDPSGLPLTVSGSSFVSIRMIGTSGAGYANPSGTATYTGPTTFSPSGTRLVAVVQQGDFEGHFSWIAGLSGPMCYRVSTSDVPARLEIDFRSR